MNINFPDPTIAVIWTDPDTNITWKFDGDMWYIVDDNSEILTKISANKANIAQMETDLKVNASWIADNLKDIAKNSIALAKNEDEIALVKSGTHNTNTADIAINTSNIAINKADAIAATAKAQVAQNTADTNAADILTDRHNAGLGFQAASASARGNTAKINVNTTGIAKNTNDIAKNKADIVALGPDDIPIDGHATVAVSSNWAADHITPATVVDPHTQYQRETEKGVANGYAGLDSAAKLPMTVMPASLVGALHYIGIWDASTNAPVLADGAGVKGEYYVVRTAGTTALGGNAIWAVNDWAIYNGATWDRLSGSSGVTSVNGASGVVTLDSDDIPEGATNKYAKEIAVKNVADITAMLALDVPIGSIVIVGGTETYVQGAKSIPAIGADWIKLEVLPTFATDDEGLDPTIVTKAINPKSAARNYLVKRKIGKTMAKQSVEGPVEVRDGDFFADIIHANHITNKGGSSVEFGEIPPAPTARLVNVMVEHRKDLLLGNPLTLVPPTGLIWGDGVTTNQIDNCIFSAGTF